MPELSDRAIRFQLAGLARISAKFETIMQDHPLPAIRVMADTAPKDLCSRLDAVYASSGWPLIAPENLARAARENEYGGLERV